MSVPAISGSGNSLKAHPKKDRIRNYNEVNRTSTSASTNRDFSYTSVDRSLRDGNSIDSLSNDTLNSIHIDKHSDELTNRTGAKINSRFVELVRQQLNSLDGRITAYIAEYSSVRGRLYRYRFLIGMLPVVLFLCWTSLLLGALSGKMLCNGHRDCPITDSLPICPRSLYAPHSVF